MGLPVGVQIPLSCQLADYSTDKYIRAYVEDSDGQPLAGSPFNLTPGTNGIYTNVAAVMPNKPWVSAVYLVYSDAAYTTLSVLEGGSSDTFFGQFEAGDPIPLYNQLAFYDDSKYVRAFVTTPAGTAIAGSPFPLFADGVTGKYKNLFGQMPSEPWVRVQYLVYNDAPYSVLSGADGGSSETIYTTEAGAAAEIPPSNIVAHVSGDCCDELGVIEDKIVQGEDKTLLIRLAGKDGSPFNLKDATGIEFRIRNIDGTVLSVDLDSTVVIENEGGGQISVALSATQTALLAPALPAPATIKVTIASKITLVNLSTQLAVEEVEVGEAE